MSLPNSVLDRTAVERIFDFLSRIGRNSRSPEYSFEQQLSQLSDGPLNSSKRLAICELRQSETRPVTEDLLGGAELARVSAGWGNNQRRLPPVRCSRKMTMVEEIPWPGFASRCCGQALGAGGRGDRALLLAWSDSSGRLIGDER
jgi:hypothetical protein